ARSIVSTADRTAVAVGHALRHAVGRPADPGRDRCVGVAVVAGAVLASIDPVLVPVAVSAVVLVVWSRGRRLRRAQARSLSAEAPLLVELVRLATGAGLAVPLAVAAVSRRAPGRSGAALADAARRIDRGEPAADALARFGTCGDPVRPLAD